MRNSSELSWLVTSRSRGCASPSQLEIEKARILVTEDPAPSWSGTFLPRCHLRILPLPNVFFLWKDTDDREIRAGRIFVNRPRPSVSSDLPEPSLSVRYF